MFNTSISGLKGSQKYLDTTSNNIANANSYGFKRSRAEFADIYCNTVFTSVKTATGMGTTTSVVAQQFSQGSLSGDTGNNLDMAISGNGFFVLSNSENLLGADVGDRTYTRNGAFELNADGYIVTAMGDYVQGYAIDDRGEVTNLDIKSTHAIKIPADTGAPRWSTEADIIANLPANAENLGKVQETTTGSEYTFHNAVHKFDPSDSDTYTSATSQTIYDSLGVAHTLTYYFLKDHTVPADAQKCTDDQMTYSTDIDNILSTSNSTVWDVIPFVDGMPVDVWNGQEFIVDDPGSTFPQTYNTNTLYGIQMVFGSDGTVIDNGTIPNTLYLSNNTSIHPTPRGNNSFTLASAMGGGIADGQDIEVEMDLTQYGTTKFSVTSVTTDGYATGQLENVQVTEDGLIMASYTNGRNIPISKVALANFNNPQGLLKVGDTQWKESFASGEVIPAQANVGMTGTIKGANLELSNVELASELVDLIIAQRTYQANAQALQTQNTAMDAIMNIR